MIINENTSRREYVLSVARAMMAAARTAPKGKGIDNLEIVTLEGDQVARLAEKMHVYAEELGRMFFHRDAENVAASDAVVLIGTRIAPIGMDCGMCGFETCERKNGHPAIPCAFNTNDMGIAVGSACALAADCRVDSRVMFSAGLSALKMGLVEGCHAVMAIPLSCTGKSPYFDRVSTRPAAL
ncbi:ferredoxin [Bacteroidia bacterium]|nr:ferredoxin [Bacteroidia bacterium]